MAPRSIPPCDHELRPGITVCLRCQHAERAAKRARQRQLIARGAAATLLLAVIAAVGIAGATAIRARMGTQGTQPAAGGETPVTVPSTQPDSTNPAVKPSGESVMRSAVATANAASALTPRASLPAQALATSGAVSGIAVAPVVPVGRTALRDTMVAERAGDTVRVSFDLMFSRTRRPDKFEQIVRSTLPQVYGSAIDSALRALPVGAVARAGDLVTTLPEQGFRIPLAGGRTIAVWPETRAGRDGPLVIAYRAVASR